MSYEIELQKVFQVHNELSSKLGAKSMDYDPDLLVVATGVVIANHLGAMSEELYHLRGELHDLAQELRTIERNTR